MSFHIQASGGQDRVVHVWDVKTNSHVHTFTGHRDTVSVSAYMYLCLHFVRKHCLMSLIEDVLLEVLYTLHFDCSFCFGIWYIYNYCFFYFPSWLMPLKKLSLV